MPDKKKSHIRFCWECGNRLWGSHFKEVVVDGVVRITHKNCTDPDRECRDERVSDLEDPLRWVDLK